MEPYIGQIMMFGGNFAPRGWAECNGQLLSIQQNSALFSILGTTYGGDGRTTFALPDLRGRVAINPGTGPGLSPVQIGQKGGDEKVTLTTNEIPSHTHNVNPRCTGGLGTETTPVGHFEAAPTTPSEDYTSTPDGAMGTTVSSATGGNAAHDNMQPFLGVTFVIALTGVYPSRN